jgi:PucR family transcriptional regulator, purine catabolism regulatory protein
VQPTVADVLALPVVQTGRPVVLAGGEHLGRRVRWVHVGEIPEVGPLLQGGELVLSTGVALPGTAAALRQYVGTLADAGVSGLVVELGRRFTELPDSLVAAGQDLGVPVVALRRPVRFVAVTETVHALILDAQHQALRLSERAHRELTALSVDGAPVQQVVDRLAAMAGQPAVLEDLSHRVLAHACPPEDVATVLTDWEDRSRRADPVPEPGAGVVGPEGWLAVPVGPTSARWGRLVLPTADDDTAPRLLLERAAEALAICRLREGDEAALVRQAHRGLLADLAEGRTTDAGDVRARVAALGLPSARHSFVGVAVHSPAPAGLDPVAAEQRDRTLSDAAAQACAQERVRALASPVRAGQVLVLAAVPGGRDTARAVERFAGALRGRLDAAAWPDPVAVGTGAATPDPAAAGASLVEAGRVAEQGVALAATRPRAVYTSRDVRLRGLLAVLADDARVQAFAEAELGALLAHDAAHGTDLAGTLAAYLAARGNKTEVARACAVSRPTLYARLGAVERVLGVDLDDADAALALQVALVVRDVSRPPPA